MAALVQTYPQQTTTVTMLPGRPSSSSAAFGAAQPSQHASSRNQVPVYNMSNTNYRAPVSQYAYSGTGRQTQTPHLRPENRASSAPVIPHSNGSNASRQQFATSQTFSNTSMRSHDDSVIQQRPNPNVASRPLSAINLTTTSSMLSINTSPSKPSPDRYRRNQRKSDGLSPGSEVQQRQPSPSAVPSGSGMAAVSHLYSHPGHSNSLPSLQSYQSFRGQNFTAGNQTRFSSVDDLNISRGSSELAKRYRRRSMNSIEPSNWNDEVPSLPSPLSTPPIQYPTRGESREWKQAQETVRPVPTHAHNGSTDSVASTRSTRSSSRPSSRKDSSSTTSAHQDSLPQTVIPITKQEVKLVTVPPRTPEPSKRTTGPSPLSNPVTASPEPKVETISAAAPVEKAPESPRKAPTPAPVVQSAAARQLEAVGKKDDKKKSKLRRAFSFGSASELRKATAQANLEKEKAANRAAKRNSKYEDELPPEQAAIAQRQEAAGLGESIYSGQGQFFTGSTDNLSISSTASSASVMLRKMGQGVKRSTKSLVGLFRPKSVIGVPAADAPIVQPSLAQVSMVTVEAEREKVNVNLDPHTQAGGGTGFPKLQRNSIEAAASGSIASTASTEAHSRRSIVGGEKERAEVLAAVRKGILKRTDSGQSSPVVTPYTFKLPDFNLPQIPNVHDSPHSSAPSTPGDDHPPRSGHRRTDSIAIEGLENEDYFSSITRFASMEKNAPTTPHGTVRNISFSPRIQFHDTWTSSDYDRRGDIATCNRLTPMLAQQIKEELNTFKMEMEVHESSKVYTHFF